MPKSNYDYPGYERSGAWYWLKTITLYVAITIGALWTIGPFWWTLTTALSADPGAGIVAIVPETVTFASFSALFDQVPVGRWFFNAFVFAGAVTIFNVTFDSLAGYAFARLDFVGRDRLFLLLIATMMIPGMVTMIPVYIILSELGWINTYRGLIVPFIASPFGIFLLRQHFLGLPEALGEAARLDGCNKFRVFYHIYLPLAKPAVATLVIFTFMFTWNNFEWPLIIATSQDMFTLPVALYTVRGQYVDNWGLVMAAATLIVIPPVIAFLSAQKYFIRGMTLSGFKG
ncbi:carbohydrate ABC transporter permease [Natronobiforma cellulositropha]|uniref:carbohydrate ABC transporter permease n=1 Tax=Natronobiforma cellulositropha TaxID=1679076 RepID=UPI0021D5C760|nr:carbohydrate ABC transporter permease [Natronobiforma cellulositropha]